MSEADKDQVVEDQYLEYKAKLEKELGVKLVKSEVYFLDSEKFDTFSAHDKLLVVANLRLEAIANRDQDLNILSEKLQQIEKILYNKG